MFYTYIYIKKMTKLEDMTLEDLRDRFIKKRAVINKSVKKHYKKYYMKDEASLTDEERKTQEERIQKRREYMNARYQKIYKPQREQLKAQIKAQIAQVAT